MLKAGFGRVTITPPFGIPLAGYFVERPMDGVLDELEIQALALHDGKKQTLILVADLLGIRAVDLLPVRKAIAQRLNMAVEAVMITCTHNHSGLEPSGTVLTLLKNAIKECSAAAMAD